MKNCANEIIQIVLMQLSHPLLTVEIQIAKTVRTKKIECRLFENCKVVLGLATSHSKEMKQVRGANQTPYQSWHSPLRWATSYAHEVAPLLLFENQVKNQKATGVKNEKRSLQTHQAG